MRLVLKGWWLLTTFVLTLMVQTVERSMGSPQNLMGRACAKIQNHFLGWSQKISHLWRATFLIHLYSWWATTCVEEQHLESKWGKFAQIMIMMMMTMMMMFIMIVFNDIKMRCYGCDVMDVTDVMVMIMTWWWQWWRWGWWWGWCWWW